MLNNKLLGSTGAVSDPNFENVSLLLQGDGTNGAQNNTFLDSSTNNFTITRNGNTTQGSFSPYGNLWSNYFDGNGDYLSITNVSALQPGASTTAFCIECWINPTVTPALETAVWGNYKVTSYPTNTDGCDLLFTNGNRVAFRWGYPNYADSGVSAAMNLNTWNHVAVCRDSSGSLSCYLNGTRWFNTSTNTSITNATASSFWVGWAGSLSGTTINPFQGYISNFRFVKGSTPYDPSQSTCAIPTTPLTAVSGTSLLTCQSNRFIDNSSNNFAITVNGNTSVQRFSPFNPTAPYSASTIGGSAYFDGSGDYLASPASSSFAFGTGAFTVEAWIYPNALSNYQGVICQLLSTGNTEWTFSTFADGHMSFQSYYDVPISTAAGVVKLGQWHHVVAVRSGTNSAIFVNGIRVASNASDTKNWSSSIAARIGYPGDTNYFNGYITNASIVKGSAVYDPTQSTITVPTEPLTAISGTSLLCNMTNAGIPDAAMMNDLETVGNAQVSTSVKKYGTGSLAFDGSTGNLVGPYNSIYAFGTGDFTVEGWFYFTDTGTNLRGLVSLGDGANGSGPVYHSWSLQYWGSEGSNQIAFSRYDGTVYTYLTSGATISQNTWVHIAACRGAGTLRIFVNGTAYYNAANSLDFSAVNTNPLRIALQYYGPSSGYSGPRYWPGYIDDLRITKGYARYTANFTPPTAALPTY